MAALGRATMCANVSLSPHLGELWAKGLTNPLHGWPGRGEEQPSIARTEPRIPSLTTGRTVRPRSERCSSARRARQFFAPPSRNVAGEGVARQQGRGKITRAGQAEWAPSTGTTSSAQVRRQLFTEDGDHLDKVHSLALLQVRDYKERLGPQVPVSSVGSALRGRVWLDVERSTVKPQLPQLPRQIPKRRTQP